MAQLRRRLPPGTLQAALDSSRTTRLALLYGDAQYCDPGGAIIGSYRTRPFDFDKLALFNFICQPAAFFRKGPFEAVGGLDHSLHYAMDYDLWIKIGRQFPCRYLPRLFASTGSTRPPRPSAVIPSSTTAKRRSRRREALRLGPLQQGLYRMQRPLRQQPRAQAGQLRAGARYCIADLFHGTLAVAERRVERKDLQLLSRKNFRKLFKSRIELMTGKT